MVTIHLNIMAPFCHPGHGGQFKLPSQRLISPIHTTAHPYLSLERSNSSICNVGIYHLCNSGRGGDLWSIRGDIASTFSLMSCEIFYRLMGVQGFLGNIGYIGFCRTGLVIVQPHNTLRYVPLCCNGISFSLPQPWPWPLKGNRSNWLSDKHKNLESFVTSYRHP